MRDSGVVVFAAMGALVVAAILSEVARGYVRRRTRAARREGRLEALRWSSSPWERGKDA